MDARKKKTSTKNHSTLSSWELGIKLGVAMRDAGAGRATTDRLPGATPPSYTTSIAHTIYVSVVRPKEVTESDQAAAETILQTSFGSSSSKNLLASLQENHGERLRLVLLHMGDTNTLAAVATLARLRNGRTLVENLCVRDQHRSRGLTRNVQFSPSGAKLFRSN